MDSNFDYYSLLAIKRNASQDEVKRAYRKAVFRYHPDRNPGDEDAAKKFKQVLDAYEVLSNSKKRANYDQVTRPAEAEAEPEEEPIKEEAPNFNSHSGNGFGSTQDFKQQQQTDAEPKCPSCSVVGIEHIVSRKAGPSSTRGKQFVLAPFNVILCNACGHVYGVTPTAS